MTTDNIFTKNVVKKTLFLHFVWFTFINKHTKVFTICPFMQSNWSFFLEALGVVTNILKELKLKQLNEY